VSLFCSGSFFSETSRLRVGGNQVFLSSCGRNCVNALVEFANRGGEVFWDAWVVDQLFTNLDSNWIDLLQPGNRRAVAVHHASKLDAVV
jgi:hypothetical protein